MRGTILEVRADQPRQAAAAAARAAAGRSRSGCSATASTWSAEAEQTTGEAKRRLAGAGLPVGRHPAHRAVAGGRVRLRAREQNEIVGRTSIRGSDEVTDVAAKYQPWPSAA